MVILNDVAEDGRQNIVEMDRTHQYVYLVDGAQKMMLIMKRDFSEMSENPVPEEKTVRDFITRQVQGLLDRMTDNSPLSFREKEILRYAALGKSNKQIGKIVGRSECTIKNHFSRILRKLQATDRTHAVALALCNGWLPGLSRE